MFQSIKGVIGDIASGAVKNERIALSQEQLTVLDRKLREAVEEVASLNERVLKLESENASLKAQLQQTHRSTGDDLGAVETSILKLLHSLYPKLPTREEFLSTMKLKEVDLDYSLRRLIDRGFMRWPVGGLWYDGHQNPDGYSITDRGIDVIRKHGKIAPPEPPLPASSLGALVHRTLDSLPAPDSGGGR